MKRALTMSILLCLLFTACNNSSVGIIGGADGPTSIIVSNGGDKVFGKQLEKRPVRMFNIDGDLYYDSGLVSENTPRCGTMDGKLKKAVGETEIPLKSGEANFKVEGYQNATSITKEVNIGGEWIIFKKYDLYNYTLDDLKYCYYIKGHLNNAAVDSEIIVLSDYANVTFNDVYEQLLNSQPSNGAGKGKALHNSILNDKWGIYLHADGVTANGMTLKIEQFGGNFDGELQTGEWFKLEKTIDDNWTPVETNPLIDYAWNDVAYEIKKNDITHLKVEWKWLYGELEPGFYRLSKEIQLRTSGGFDKNLYEVYFTVEE